MGDQMDEASVAATVSEIEAHFGQRWGVWLSDTGRWWAARRDALSAQEINAGCVPYVQGSTPGELRNRMAGEEHLVTRAGPEKEDA